MSKSYDFEILNSPISFFSIGSRNPVVFPKNDVATFLLNGRTGFHAQQSLTQASHLIFMETVVSGMDRQSEGN